MCAIQVYLWPVAGSMKPTIQMYFCLLSFTGAQTANKAAKNMSVSNKPLLRRLGEEIPGNAHDGNKRVLSTDQEMKLH